MTTAVPVELDTTPLGRVVRSAILLGVVQAVVVAIVSVITQSIRGPVEHTLTGIVVFAGALFTIFYPGTVSRPRTIEGIATGAGIGLGATWIFLLFDAFLLQQFGAYTNRWLHVGGGSVWWYIPVWWMVGTFAAWQGTWIQANQLNRNGRTSIPSAIVLLLIITAVLGVLAAATHVPHAHWNVATFAASLIPALAVTNFITALGGRRR